MDKMLNIDFLINLQICLLAPIVIYLYGGFNLSIIYLLGVIAFGLNRIGNIIRSK